MMITIAISLDVSVNDSRIQKNKFIWITIISFNKFVIAKSILSTIFAISLSKLKRYVDLSLNSNLARRRNEEFTQTVSSKTRFERIISSIWRVDLAMRRCENKLLKTIYEEQDKSSSNRYRRSTYTCKLCTQILITKRRSIKRKSICASTYSKKSSSNFSSVTSDSMMRNTNNSLDIMLLWNKSCVA